MRAISSRLNLSRDINPGFKIVRQGKHIVMSDGSRFITIPRHNPVNALTMGGIVKDAGMSVEEFRHLL
jgi:hypothetical protein